MTDTHASCFHLPGGSKRPSQSNGLGTSRQSRQERQTKRDNDPVEILTKVAVMDLIGGLGLC